MNKRPFVTKEQVEEIAKTYPTPFHIYDEKGIRENVKALKEAFSWNPGYKEYFAVKATPNPFLIDILKEYGCGCDCSSYTELLLSEAMDIKGHNIMFSSNDTPAEDFILADKLGAIINLDDITHIDFLEKAIGHIPETISCRYNPGGLIKISNDIMDNPGDAIRHDAGTDHGCIPYTEGKRGKRIWDPCISCQQCRNKRLLSDAGESPV